MPRPTPLRLLPLAEPRARSASTHPRLSRGGPGCRALSTAAALAAIDTPAKVRADLDALIAASAGARP